MQAFGRSAYTFVVAAFLILYPLQFLFAGYGVFSGQFDTHAAFGGILLHLLVLLALVFAGLGRLGWPRAGWALLVFLGMGVQISFVEAGEPWLQALHVFLAFCWWPVALYLLWRPVREGGAPAAAAADEEPAAPPAS